MRILILFGAIMVVTSSTSALPSLVPGDARQPAGRTPASTKPRIVNMERLNTAADEDDPSPSPDGRQFFYTTANQKGEKALYLSTRQGTTDPLSAGKVMDELSGEKNCQSPWLLPKDKDGWEFLYFATQYHTGKSPEYNLYRVGRFSSSRPFQGFNAASPVQATASNADEIAPWVSADAKQLYFSRKTTEGWLLMKCDAREPHAFGKPEPAGLPTGYHRAVLSRSGLTMIVQGPHKAGESRQGLFVCKRAKLEEAWSEPKPLHSLNSDDGTLGTVSPGLSGDTRYLYFASDRPGGKGGLDLYVVAVSEVEELKK
jgi:hypothetical protein